MSPPPDDPPDHQGNRPEVHSMFRAASALQNVLEMDRSDPAWRRQVRLALGNCVVAVEGHLGALASPDGLEEDIARREPRLVAALEKLSVALSQLMLHLWETRDEAGQPGPIFTRRLHRLVDEMRDVAAEEFMLVVESFNPTGTGD